MPESRRDDAIILTSQHEETAGLTALPYRAADDADFFPLPAGYRQDPRWIAAQADYIREDDGEADTAITMRRIEAAYRMYDIQREYADGAP